MIPPASDAGRCVACGRDRARVRFCQECDTYPRTHGLTEGADPPSLYQMLCPVPTPADAVCSEGAWMRYHHHDIAALSDAKRAQERAQVRLRLSLEPAGTEAARWLAARVHALDGSGEASTHAR